MRWQDKGDAVIAWIGCLGCLVLLTLMGIDIYELGRANERKAIMASWECPKGTAYSVTYLDGSRKCQMYWRKG